MNNIPIQLPKFNNPLIYAAGQDTIHYGRESGGTTKHRHGLDAMLTFLYDRYPEITDRKARLKILEKPRCVLIVWRWNRAMRDRILRSSTRLNLLLRGVIVHGLMGQPTTGNAMIDDIFDLLEGYSDEKLLDDIAGDTKRALHLNAEKRDTDAEFRALNLNWITNDGRYLGITAANPPVGLKAEWVLVGIRERKRNGKPDSEKLYLQRWVPDDSGVTGSGWERAKRAWEMALQGKSYTEIHEECHLFDNLNSYSKFFANRIYAGDYQYGDVLYTDFVPGMVERKDF